MALNISCFDEAHCPWQSIAVRGSSVESDWAAVHGAENNPLSLLCRPWNLSSTAEYMNCR